MEFKVLGALKVLSSNGARVNFSSISQRRLLSMLLLRSGSTVSANYLADHLEVSTGALRTSVSRLRRVVGFECLATCPPGYELRSETIDAKTFEWLLDEARASVGFARRCALECATGLWHGKAYAEFAQEPWAITEVLRLEELRWGAVEDLAELLIAAKEWSRVTAQLEEEISNEPFRDRPRMLLMEALDGSGRRTDALRAFQNYRRFLRNEIGVEPSQAVTTLDRLIAQSQNSPTLTPRNLPLQRTTSTAKTLNSRAIV
jgi:DNA-binding SARP family transcriptional activator